MGISLKQYAGSTIAPKDDAIMYDALIGASGTLTGCELTSLGGGMVRISAGRGIIKGRQFVIDEEVLNVQLATSGELLGRIYLHMDLANTEEPIAIKSITAAVLPELVKDEECNYSNGVYELELGTYTASMLAVSNLTKTVSEVEASYKNHMLQNLEEVSVVTEQGYIPDALAVKEVNEKLAGCWISFTDEEGNPTDIPYIHWIMEG